MTRTQGDPALRALTAHPEGVAGIPTQPVESQVSPAAGFAGQGAEASSHGRLATRGAAWLAQNPKVAEALLGTIGFADATVEMGSRAREYGRAARQSGGDVVGIARHGIAAAGPALREANQAGIVDEAAIEARRLTEQAEQRRGAYTARRQAERAADESGDVPSAWGFVGTAVAAAKARSAARKQRRAVDHLAAQAHVHEQHKAATTARTDRVAAHGRSISARMAAVGKSTAREV